MYVVLCPLRIIYSYIPDFKLARCSCEVDSGAFFFFFFLRGSPRKMSAVTPRNCLAIHRVESRCRPPRIWRRTPTTNSNLPFHKVLRTVGAGKLGGNHCEPGALKPSPSSVRNADNSSVVCGGAGGEQEVWEKKKQEKLSDTTSDSQLLFFFFFLRRK